MKIFVIARGYPSDQEPTWGCFEKDQAEALAKLGHHVTYLGVDTRFRKHRRSLGMKHNIINQVSIYILEFIPFALLFFIPKRLKEKFYTYLYYKIFKQAIKQEGVPDVLYAHYLGYMKYALLFSKKYNIPAIGLEHWSKLAAKHIQPDMLSLAQQIYPQLNQLITVSNFLKNNIQRNIDVNNIQVVPNLLGDEFTYQSNNTKHPLTIVSAGRLVPSKRFDLLIDAVHQIQTSLPKEWKLLIIGGGDMKTALQEQINTLHLQEHIQLLGQQTKAEIVRLFQQSDIFALPSQMETFGVVYIEALACGLPIIATNCGGPSDIITKENGILIPNEDIEALKEAILHISNNLKDYNREAIAKDCQARFAPEVIAKRLTIIFEETIKTHKEQQ